MLTQPTKTCLKDQEQILHEIIINAEMTQSSDEPQYLGQIERKESKLIDKEPPPASPS
jgi:hypothetical protein